MGPEVIKNRFPNIFKHCLDEGYDITRECIPVTPAQHYFMGGIKVDLESRTSMAHLYAIGEVSCNRVHAANRLAAIRFWRAWSLPKERLLTPIIITTPVRC